MPSMNLPYIVRDSALSESLSYANKRAVIVCIIFFIVFYWKFLFAGMDTSVSHWQLLPYLTGCFY